MIIVGNTIVSDDIADRCFSCDLSCCRGACCVEGDSGAPLLEEEVPILEAILPDVEPYLTPEGIAAVREQGVAVRDKDGDLGTTLIQGGACAYAIQENGLTLCAIEKAYRENQNLVNSEKLIVNSEKLIVNSEKLIVNRKETTSLNSQFTIHNSLSIHNYPKPLSCHLYPIRVEDYGEFTAVNYHQWDICQQGLTPSPLSEWRGVKNATTDAGNYSPLRAERGEGVRPPLYLYLKEPLIRRFGQEWYDELLQEIKNKQ